ncbi:MAG: hypothetical protein RPS47_11735 [Colwellia sp.]|jgi:hypothetical protein
MYKQLRNIALLIACGSSLSSHADSTYQLDQINSFTTGLYPALDLGNATSTILETSISNNVSNDTSVDKLTITFPEANDLIATGFKFNGNEYVSVVDDAWVFSKVLVSIYISPNPSEASPVHITLSVMDSESNLNASTQDVNTLSLLAGIDGQLKDVTLKTLADTVTTEYQDKALTLNLYRDLKSDMGATAFDLSISWLGHGGASIKLPAPIPSNEMSQYSAVSLTLNNDGPEPIIELSFLNSQSYKEVLLYTLSEIVMLSGL